MFATLLVPTLRAMSWRPFLAGPALGLMVVAVPAAMPVTLTPGNLIMLLRLAAVCAGLGTAFLLDDPAKPTTSTAPTPGWMTVIVRAAVGVSASAVWWAAALGATIAGAAEGVGEALPRSGLTLEVGTVLAAAFALAAVGWRHAPRGVASPAAAPAVLVVVILAALLPEHLALLVGVEEPGWSVAHGRWLVLLVAELMTALFAVSLTPKTTYYRHRRVCRLRSVPLPWRGPGPRCR
jgi:hypothetical protein